MRAWISACLVATVFAVPLKMAAAPGDDLRRALQQIFQGAEFKGYQFYQPVKSQWGLGTMFEEDLTNKRGGRGPTIALPEDWWSPSVSEEEKAQLKRELFIRGQLGFKKLVAPVSKSVDIKANLPFIFFKKLLSVGGSYQRVNESTVTITAVTAEQRELNFPAFFRAVRAGKFRPEVVERVNRADYMIVSHDIVFYGYEASVEGAVQTKLSLGVEVGPTTELRAASKDAGKALTDSKSPQEPTAELADEKVKSADEKSKRAGETSKPADDKAKTPPTIEANGTATIQTGPARGSLVASAPADVPMIVAVYLANAPRIPAQGALTKPTLRPADVNTDLLSRTLASLEEAISPPQGVVVVSSPRERER